MTKPLNKVSDNHLNSSKQPLSRETLEAGAALRPCFLAANSITHYNRVLGKLDLMAVADELGLQINRIKNGDMDRAEETLAAQAAVLDSLFNSLAIKALQAPGLDLQAVVLKLALQAQKQCCKTYGALASIKNPPVVTVVRQTNIGQAVQVNNGIPNDNSTPILENKLLESNYGERLDSRTKNASGSADHDLAAVERLDRAEK